MGRLSIKNKEMLQRIVYERRKLKLDVMDVPISASDIEDAISKYGPSFFFMKDKYGSCKDALVRRILISPFLLCDQENLDTDMQLLIPKLLEYRYNLEIEEIDHQLKQGLISKKEYDEIKGELDFAYYGSSKDGRSILSTGMTCETKKKVLKSN